MLINKKSALVKYKGQVELTLVERKLMTHDTYLFRFGLPEKDLVMGTNVSNHIRLNLVAPTKEFPTGILIRRKYTPTSDVNLEGYVDLPIKIYRPGVHPKFPNGGEFTPILEKLKIGDKVLADGPYKRIEYFGDGYFKIGAKIHK